MRFFLTPYFLDLSARIINKISHSAFSVANKLKSIHLPPFRHFLLNKYVSGEASRELTLDVIVKKDGAF